MEQAIACRRAFTDTLLRLAQNDARIYALTSDARGSVALNEFAAALPQRLIETGIAEQNEIGVAAGMALAGKTAFVCAPAPFLSARSYEQLKLDVAYNRANVKVVGASGGVSYGTLGASHHALQDIAATRSIEGLTVFVPSDAVQTAALTEWMAENEGPVYLRMGRAPVPVLYAAGQRFVPGKAVCLAEGRDVSLLAVGEMVAPALDAARLLRAEGIHARVLDLFSIKPIDADAVCAAARETGCIVTAEEHSIYGGLGGAVAELTAQHCPVPLRILGLPDEPVFEGEAPDVLRHNHLDAPGIAAAARAVIARKKG